MVRADGTPVIIDFGISKRIVRARIEDRRSISLGSPYFMSPEQISGEPIDVRSDLYSFGALMYQVITGQVPFSSSYFDVSRIFECRKHLPSLGPALHRFQPIIDRTLAADRSKRFSTAQDLIDMIRYCMGGQQRTDDCETRSVA